MISRLEHRRAHSRQFWPLIAAACGVEFGAQGAGRGFGFLSAFLPAVVLSPFMVAKTEELTGSYVPGLSMTAVLTLLGAGACFLMTREPDSEAVPVVQSLTHS